MLARPVGWLAGALFLGSLLGACSSTVLRDSWRDPQWSAGPLRSVLVIGVARSPAHRRIFEDGFTRALRAEGTGASASYPLLPEEGAIPNERIKQGGRGVDQGFLRGSGEGDGREQFTAWAGRRQSNGLPRPIDVAGERTPSVAERGARVAAQSRDLGDQPGSTAVARPTAAPSAR